MVRIGEATVGSIALPTMKPRRHSDSRFIATHHRLGCLKRLSEAVSLGMSTSRERSVQERCTVPEDQVAYSMTRWHSG